MINVQELRPGNQVLMKNGSRIIMAHFTPAHFEQAAKEGTKDIFPVVLKAELLEKCGFAENKDYPLLPDAREFVLVLPVAGSHKNELRAYIKNNKECFGRATLDGFPASNNFYHLHQLQNIFFALTGRELPVS
jgi:hypothetical protein